MGCSLGDLMYARLMPGVLHGPGGLQESSDLDGWILLIYTVCCCGGAQWDEDFWTLPKYSYCYLFV